MVEGTVVGRRVDWERLGAVGLVAAATLVGIAIAVDGPAARTVNGIGGALWLVSLGALG